MTKKINKETTSKYEVKIPKVNNPRDFHGERIESFTGTDYDDAMQNAYDWQNRNPQVHLVDYFPQSAFGRSILVSYNINPKFNPEEKG